MMPWSFVRTEATSLLIAIAFACNSGCVLPRVDAHPNPAPTAPPPTKDAIAEVRKMGVRRNGRRRIAAIKASGGEMRAAV